MFRLLKRLIFVGLLAGGGYYAFILYKERQAETAAAGEPAWPPLQPSKVDNDPERGVAAPHFTQISEQHTEHTEHTEADQAGERWILPVDGRCPEGYPVKANDHSGIFHVPGGRSYERTVPERCYASTDDAIADGYRQAKS